MIAAKNLFLDSCIFIRFLTRSPSEMLTEIDQYVSDAMKGERRIYFSTIALAEIRPKFFKGGKFGSIQEFFRHFDAGFEGIEPNPNILVASGHLKDAVPTNPETGADSERVVGTPDAIHLCTCLYARDTRGISDIVFHTFDKGKGKTWEGKCVSLLDFEKWFPEEKRIGVVSDVCSLTRSHPLHPQLPLLEAPHAYVTASTAH